ncbi:MATE family efflux transporter [Sphingomonas sp. MMS24-JH45]
MGLIGVTEVAAHAIALNIASLAFQAPLGVAQAATIRVGMGFGARDDAWVARAGWTAIVVGTAFMVVTAALMWAVPRLLIAIYVDVDAPQEARVVRLAIQIAVGALFQLFDGAQAVAAGVLRGLQDTRVPMVIAALGYWIAVGFGTAIALGFWADWQGVGIWAGLCVGLIVVSAALLWRFARRDRLGLMRARTA